MSNALNVIDPWYKEGLPFKCTGCGQCCTGAPGYVWVSEEEIEQIAEFLGLTVKEFSQNYLRFVDGKYSLRELQSHRDEHDCVFLKEKKCEVYSVRPKQCRTFPWWQSHLKSEEEWTAAAMWCEGINHPDAPLVPFDTIQEQLTLQESGRSL